MRVGRWLPLGALVGCGIASTSCQGSLAPLGEVVLYVDTDVAVPRAAGTLRVDVYRTEGDLPARWIESREWIRESPRDWPLSFGLYLNEGVTDGSLLVRLRLYPSGFVRDYRGERFSPRPSENGDPYERFRPPVVEGEGPRLVRGSTDATPTSEPEPGVTVDRLVQIPLRQGERQSLGVRLHGACVGTMANLARAETCVNEAGVLLTAAQPELRGEIAVTATGTWPQPTLEQSRASCSRFRDDHAHPDERICVPGDTFIVGDRRQNGAYIDVGGAISREAGPERTAVVRGFVVDKYEVTVGRYRRALARGFRPRFGAGVNDGAFSYASIQQMCTYTTDVGPRENFPLNCFVAEEARDFCAFEGGRFLREVEWEYLATNGMNGVRKTPTPWGNDDGASCAGLIVARDESGPAARCKGLGGGPAPVDAVELADVTARDKNMLGVVGLIGNLSELVDDGAASYLSRCWLTSPLDAMGCDPTRATRGGMTRGDSWQDITVSPALRAVATDLKQGSQGSPTVGFRCVYEMPQ